MEAGSISFIRSTIFLCQVETARCAGSSPCSPVMVLMVAEIISQNADTFQTSAYGVFTDAWCLGLLTKTKTSLPGRLCPPPTFVPRGARRSGERWPDQCRFPRIRPRYAGAGIRRKVFRQKPCRTLRHYHGPKR